MTREGPADDELRWLFSLERFGIKLGLEAVRILLADLGWPLRATPGLLVAGTNGKGSTAAMAAALLTAAGHRTLLYTSPHVRSVRERIVVDGRPVAGATLARRLAEVRASIRRLMDGGALPHHPTFFETLTAAALLHGRRRKVDAAVLEVGLGGRYDATNAVPAQVAVITPVDRDHEAQLGPGLRRIAWNKAGIIHPGATVITCQHHASALDVIRTVTAEKGTALRVVPAAAAGRRDDGRWDLRLRGRWSAGLGLPPSLPKLRLGLGGPGQGTNALLALAAAAAVHRRLDAAPLKRRTLRSGLQEARLPGRHEWRRLRGGRRLLLDAAHNAPAAVALAGAVAREIEDRPLTLLFGVMRDKNARRMLDALLPRADTLILTRPRHPRALPPSRLRAALAPRPARVVADPEQALEAAVAATPPDGVVLVTGSFYLLGDLGAVTARLPRLDPV